uniref:Uncharacterized protein n=1 Tax=Arundo donax TaxID=35708 RepID=A0A0A9C2R9_ARUDO
MFTLHPNSTVSPPYPQLILHSTISIF